MADDQASQIPQGVTAFLQTYAAYFASLIENSGPVHAREDGSLITNCPAPTDAASPFHPLMDKGVAGAENGMLVIYPGNPLHEAVSVRAADRGWVDRTNELQDPFGPYAVSITH